MQSIDRMLRILEAVADHSESASAVEIADATGLSLSTVARLLVQFSELGLLHRYERDRRYSLGPRLYALARAADRWLDLGMIARPYLDELRDLTGETVSLHILRGDHRVCIAESPSAHPLRRVVPVGLGELLAGSATGAVLLADSDPADHERALTPLSGAERRAFEKTLRHAVEHHWALVEDDYVPDLLGISVSVRDSHRTYAAVSASGPSNRFSSKAALSHLEQMQKATAEISKRLVWTSES